jgi:malate synthase
VDIEEMIYELREYCCGANAGRWDYIFSIIKRLQSKPEAVLPDRKQVGPQELYIVGSKSVRLVQCIWKLIYLPRFP